MSVDFDKYLDRQIEKRRGYQGYSTTPRIPPVITDKEKVATEVFCINDKVSVRGAKGIITDIYYDWFGGEIEYEVTFTDRTIPQKDKYKKKDLIYLGKDNSRSNSDYKIWVDDEKYCPICGDAWNIDRYHGQWKDCLKCKKRREDIVK